MTDATAANGGAQGAPGTPGAVDPQADPFMSARHSSGFTHEQLQTLTKDLVAAGRLSEEQAAALYTQTLVDQNSVTPAQAAEYLKNAGMAPPRAETQPAKPLDQMLDRVNGDLSLSPLNPSVRSHLESLGLNPARDISEYRFPRNDSGDAPTAQDMQADKLGRTWLMAGGFSANNGSTLVEEIEKVIPAYERLSETEQTIWRQQQEQLARQVLGEFGQDANQRIELAKRLVHEIDERHPGLKELLDETGAGSSAMVIKLFATQAEALARRQAR